MESPCRYKLPRVAGVYVTRKCNLHCDYCGVKYKLQNKELSSNEWIRAISIIKRLGIERIVILGGEPTLKRGIEEIVHCVVSKTDLDLLLVSNGTADKKHLSALAKAGLNHFGASIDTLEGQEVTSNSVQYKSKQAMFAFTLMRQLGVKYLTAYFVLNRSSFHKVVHVSEYLSRKGIWLYILPYHYANTNGMTWETRAPVKNPNLALCEQDIAELEKVIALLIKKKQEGYLIANTVEYLIDIPKYSIGLNWHCPPDSGELRIDADGSIMCCHDVKGDECSQYNIFNIENDIVSFQQARRRDSYKCPGCFWPSQYHSQNK